ncbi:MAG: DEAD/DEAH box helicase family protein [Bacilli bacterium]|nr:DEAD/DEAH box helicase family protein [Bacilli bacterium]
MSQNKPIEVIEKLKNELYISRGLGFEFREHQINAIKGYLANISGLFDICCGVGKTLIQACIIYLEILRCKAAGKPFVGLFVCHRLLLEEQIKLEYVTFFGSFFEAMGVKLVVLNSNGDNSLEAIASKNMKTGFNESVLYFTTTKSMNDYVKHHNSKITDGYVEAGIHIFKNITTYIHDEGHKESSSRMVQAILTAMVKERCYWFTATPGEYLTKNLSVISECNFATAVQAGYIVKPSLYTIRVNDLEHLDVNAEANSVITAFKHLKEYKKGEIPSLITFHDSVDKVRSVGNILNEYKTQHAQFNANVYEIVSDKTITDDTKGKVWLAGIRLNGRRSENGKLYTKKEILEILRNDKGPKIILNAFMLTEGIDLPQINGVAIMCEKSDASLYQAISRGCRKCDGKENFYLYTLIENKISDRVEQFISELVKFTGCCFDFGGHIEDVNNGSTNEEENEDFDEACLTQENEIFKSITVLIKKKKTEFDRFKVIKDEVKKFEEQIKAVNTLEKLHMIEEYSEKWAGLSELKEEYLTQEKVFSYLY